MDDDDDDVDDIEILMLEAHKIFGICCTSTVRLLYNNML